jgi:diguanylate cyclase (GGDEF)-like protein
VPAVSSLVLPAGLLALAALALNLPLLPTESLQAFLRVYPWVVLVLGVLLGLRFRRGRVVLALLALALADVALRSFPAKSGTDDVGAFAFAVVSIVLPLDLVWLALARERGTLTWNGLLRFTMICAQFGGAALLWMLFDHGLTEVLVRPFLPVFLVPTARLPHAALATFAFALVLTAAAWFRVRSFLEGGFFWAVVASALALAATGDATVTYLATAGLVLVVALVEATFAMAYRDALTGLPARRAFDEALGKLSGRFAIAMVDIDHFKTVNDRYGHDVGDQVLRMVATRLARIADARAFRFGGEEFALIFQGKSCRDAARTLEKEREQIEKVDFGLRGEDRPKRKPKQVTPRRSGAPKLNITVSAGVAEQGGRLALPEDVLRAADEALYRAKRSGRNRVIP